MSGQCHALGQVDGSTWTSDSYAPGQVPSPTDHLVKCYFPERHLAKWHLVALSQVITQTDKLVLCLLIKTSTDWVAGTLSFSMRAWQVLIQGQFKICQAVPYRFKDFFFQKNISATCAMSHNITYVHDVQQMMVFTISFTNNIRFPQLSQASLNAWYQSEQCIMTTWVKFVKINLSHPDQKVNLLIEKPHFMLSWYTVRWIPCARTG